MNDELALLNNRYQIIKPLSANSSKKTFLAVDTSSHPQHKCVIQESGLKNAQDFHLFCQTLQIVGLHPQIPTLLNTFTQAENFYFVWEWIVGKNLAQESLLNCDHIIHLLKESLPILQWLHDHQTLHGDLKPSNFIYQSDKLFFVDFRSAHFLNHSTTLLGDPCYSAPEQLQGKASYSSDLYSLGMICFHLLTGMSPFDLLEPPLPQITNPTLSQILEHLIETDVNKRFQSAKEVLQTMQKLGLMRREQSIKVPLWHCYATLKGQLELFVAISPNGQILATGSDNKTIYLWDFQTTEEIGCLEGKRGFIKSVAFSSDGQQLASGNADGTIHIWDIQKQALMQTLIGHEQAVNALLYRSNGHLISASTDKTIKLWNTSKEETIATLTGHSLGVTAIALHTQQPLMATASLDRTVKLWHLDTLKLIDTLKSHTWAVRSLAFTGKMPVLLATGGDDNLILLWDLTTKQVIKTISGHSWSVTGLSFSQEGQILISCSWDKTIKLWQVATGKLITVLEEHTDSVCAISVHPSSSVIVSASKDQTVKFWRNRG